MMIDKKLSAKVEEKDVEALSSTSTTVPVDAEDARLNELGVRRELRKEFTTFSTLSFALGVLGYVINFNGDHS